MVRSASPAHPWAAAPRVDLELTVTPTVSSPLVDVRVQQRPGPGVPDVVLVGQAPEVTLGPGANRLGVDEQWLAQWRGTRSGGAAPPGSAGPPRPPPPPA